MDTGGTLSYQDFCNINGQLVNFLEYYKILHAIPTAWKYIIKMNVPSATQSQNTWRDRFFNTKLPLSKFCYGELLNGVSVSNEGICAAWQVDLNTQLSTKDIALYFKRIRLITLCTKLRYFQYRVLCRKITTNVLVSKWDINVLDACSFCANEKETLVHLLFECPFSQKIWKAASKWFKHFYLINPTFSKRIVIFNNYTGRMASLVNLFIVIAKFHIYKQKVLGLKPNFSVLAIEVVKYKTIDKTIAVRKDKIYKYARKWDDFSIFHA